jgi:predicted nucleic acid-binding protein
VVVADASTIVDALTHGGARGDWARSAVFERAPLVAPHLIDVEVVSGLRRLNARRVLPERRARTAIDDFQNLGIRRFPATALLERVWQLRLTLSPYDAAYVALAESFGLPLVTTDMRLGRSHGHRAEIITPP